MLGIVYATRVRMHESTLLAVVTLIVCAISLWAGRGWMKATLITKWTGICLAAYVVVSLAFLPFTSSLTLLPFFFLLLPLAAYDLFVQQPWKGRFARARAERRGLPE
jgi:hypothetical protein